ncbi:DUF3164 family protein [Aequorivita sp. H23M31]|uniref:DUF3164 family protein n=1 Tax=Aequorivita ciconiae TaxID=2494375 RepID=A0A410G287_9FLAO|nr:DUF3164 family protein [Aequorivita sp. H23M31]QAA81384.1 DUF3164 family protein [Aequorivita sp. H23M31]
MSTQTIDLSTLSASELKAELERRQEAEIQGYKTAKKQFRTDKDNFALHAAGKFKQLQKEMKEIKEYTIREANKLYDRMYTIEGKEPKETKSFSLKNEEDTIKVTVDRQERFEFNEEATVHINAIKDIFREKFEARHKGMYNLLDGLLIKGTKGEYDPKLLAKARKQVRELGDDNLIAEFDKLDDCQRVVGSSLYCRLYMKDDKQKWQDVSLQFSSL